MRTARHHTRATGCSRPVPGPLSSQVRAESMVDAMGEALKDYLYQQEHGADHEIAAAKTEYDRCRGILLAALRVKN